MKPSLWADGPMPPVRYILRSDHVVPDAFQGVEQSLVAGQRGHVGHAAVQVHRPHGVAGHFGLLADRLVVLGVFAEQLALVGSAAHVEEEFGLVEVRFSPVAR